MEAEAEQPRSRFRDDRLVELHETGGCPRLPPETIRRTLRILDALLPAEDLDDMRKPGWRLEPLKGRARGYWSVRVNQQWRIVWWWEDNTATEIEFVDYH